jgi:hypothetical protein
MPALPGSQGKERGHMNLWISGIALLTMLPRHMDSRSPHHLCREIAKEKDPDYLLWNQMMCASESMGKACAADPRR